MSDADRKTLEEKLEQHKRERRKVTDRLRRGRKKAAAQKELEDLRQALDVPSTTGNDCCIPNICIFEIASVRICRRRS